jgi:Fic family protein
VGAWRKKESGAMQVVSGPIGRENVHFQAPGHDRLKSEMAAFLKWLNADTETDVVLKSALAHFWFVTIHPFEDGNGRIARAIADMMLARSENTAQRFYSMSAQIQQERNAYYDVLEQSQKGTLDITRWIEWYLNCLRRAIDASGKLLATILVKNRFWNLHKGETLNERQRKVLNRLLDGFEGKLTSSKWARLAKCSQDTAGRDINDLLERKILAREEAGGRSTSYSLVESNS